MNGTDRNAMRILTKDQLRETVVMAKRIPAHTADECGLCNCINEIYQSHLALLTDSRALEELLTACEPIEHALEMLRGNLEASYPTKITLTLDECRTLQAAVRKARRRNK